MFSSPARPIKGTPRRTGNLSRAPRTPSVFLEREREHEAIPPPSTARTNRLAHLRRDDSPSTSVAETVRTVREVEGYERISWSRDERRAVNSLGGLPKEVNALVKSLGEFRWSWAELGLIVRWRFEIGQWYHRYRIWVRYGRNVHRL